MHEDTPEITELINKAAVHARKAAAGMDKPDLSKGVKWPVECTVGPGLEGAIACETRIAYVNGARGELSYRGFDIFDLCANSSYEEVCYLLLHGRLPTTAQLESFTRQLRKFGRLPNTLRMMMGFPLEEMNPMSALRVGTNFMRQRLTWRDTDTGRPSPAEAISADEDSIAMETDPSGQAHATYEFGRLKKKDRPAAVRVTDNAVSMDSCIRLIAGMPTLAAGISRLRRDMLPIEPDPELGHAANFLYMMTGKKPTAYEARLMDVALILHAEHGMNASTFATLVVGSTLSDYYFSIGAGIAALNGPLHGGANEAVLKLLRHIGRPENAEAFVNRSLKHKDRIMGFGHRVYKAPDPRALVLGPLAGKLRGSDPENKKLFKTARALEKAVVSKLGKSKGIYPNVDFYSGLVYKALGIPEDMFTPVFAVSRVAGWTARLHEYLKKNRIFRPRAWYVGKLGKEFVPIEDRD